MRQVGHLLSYTKMHGQQNIKKRIVLCVDWVLPWHSQQILEFTVITEFTTCLNISPYPAAFPYGNGMVLHFYQQQESSTTKTGHRVINKGLKTYV